jgi:hypothetical protein
VFQSYRLFSAQHSLNEVVFSRVLLPVAISLSSMSLSSKHQDDSDDELVLAAQVSFSKRRKILTFSQVFVKAADDILRAYITFRGGMHAVETFENDAGIFDWDSYCNKLFVQDLRFSKQQVETIVHCLIVNCNFPTHVVSYAGDKSELRIAFLMLCMKYAWPTRLGHLRRLFGTSISRISRVIKALREMIFQRFFPKMRCPNVLSADQIQRFAHAVSEKSGIDVVFGFLDGTVRPICRPSIGQSEFYTGKDRLHAIKFQICSTPDGIIRHIDGPWPGRRHDAHMVNSSPLSTGSPALSSWILSHPPTRWGTQFVVFADQGYYKQPGIEVPWPDAEFNVEHAIFNDLMKTSRIAVEWEFGHILEHWAALHYRPGQKILTNMKLGQMYIVAAFLTNVFNCLHPSKTSLYFNCAPPSLEGYLSSLE